MIVVTGGAGFIGSNLVHRLDSLGNDVVIVDWFGSDDKWLNLRKCNPSRIISPENVENFWVKNSGNVEAVFHLGAVSSTTETDVDKIIQNNLTISQSWWKKCAKERIPFIYASSAATYGDGEKGFDDFSSSKMLRRLCPLNAYGWSKHLFDMWAIKQSESEQITPPSWVGFKFFNVYGANEYHKGPQRSVVHQIFESIKNKGNANLFKSNDKKIKDGEQKRDFIFIEDCVDAMIWAMGHQSAKHILNLGTGQARTFLDLAKAVFLAMGARENISFFEMPESLSSKYQNFTEANVSNLRRAGFTKEFTSLEDGIKTYVQNYLMKEDRYL